MTGHFTSYENRTDHELATIRNPGVAIAYAPPDNPTRSVGAGSEKAWRTMAFCHVARKGDRADGRFVG